MLKLIYKYLFLTFSELSLRYKNAIENPKHSINLVMSNVKLTSVECSDIINWIAFNKHDVALNKTQMQKLLYICYGLYLAKTDKKLFDDDTPKAWPFGPVFPRVNKYFTPGVINDITDTEISKLNEYRDAFDIIVFVVEKFHKFSAVKLSEWSHREDGPWHKTVYGDDGKSARWNTEIPDDLIKAYFKPIKN